jgi:DNA-binding MarR family transcriptional regulator
MSKSEIPRDYESLKAHIIVRAAELPRRLTQVAAYALEHPDEIAFGTVASIAQAASVQPSTLVRFAQSLGYQGFSDLQDVFRSRLRDRILNYDERIEHLRQHDLTATKATVIFGGFSEAAEKSLNDLREKLDPEKLEQVVDMLAKADTIYLIGLRRSFPITSYMSYASDWRHGWTCPGRRKLCQQKRCGLGHKFHALCVRNCGPHPSSSPAPCAHCGHNGFSVFAPNNIGQNLD